jgi:hypothetical protein
MGESTVHYAPSAASVGSWCQRRGKIGRGRKISGIQQFQKKGRSPRGGRRGVTR